MEAGVVLELHFTRQELAALAGVSRATFARLLTKFQQIGVLTIERRRLLPRPASTRGIDLRAWLTSPMSVMLSAA
jgi:hypothetical protein